MGVFAEFERAMIRERVNAGLTRAKAQGKKLGRPGCDDAAVGCRSCVAGPRPVPAGLRILGWHQLGPWAHLELGPWAHLGPITAGLWEPKLCGVLGLCTPMAWLTSICYNAGEGSLALEGDKNVAKKEERTHAGS